MVWAIWANPILVLVWIVVVGVGVSVVPCCLFFYLFVLCVIVSFGCLLSWIFVVVVRVGGGVVIGLDHVAPDPSPPDPPPPDASGPPGLHTTTRELQTCTFDGPGASKHHRKTTRRHTVREKERNWR